MTTFIKYYYYDLLLTGGNLNLNKTKFYVIALRSNQGKHTMATKPYTLTFNIKSNDTGQITQQLPTNQTMYTLGSG